MSNLDDYGITTALLPRKKLPLRLKLCYGVGHVLNDLCASMWFTYLLLYFHAVLDFSNKLSGVIILVGQVADALSTPFVGIESDRKDDFWLCKYGRRKTWHLIGTLCVLGSFPFLFVGCIGCESSSNIAQLIYYCAFVIIFQFGWASVQISHLSLIPDLTNDQHEKTELTAIRYAFTVMSNICVYSITWVILGISSLSHNRDTHSRIGPEDALTFRNIVFIVISLGALFSFIFHLGVKEKKQNPQQQIQKSDVPISINVGEIPHQVSFQWKDWLTSVQFYVIAVLYMSTRLFVNLSQVYIPLYLQDTLKLKEESVAIVPLIMYIVGFFSSLLMKSCNQKIGRKFAYLLGILIGISACFWIYWGEGEHYKDVQLYIVAALFGIGGSTVLITSLSITADLIGNNTDSSAFVYGSMSFTDKLANGIVILIIQYLHPCDDCCVECHMYYRDVLFFGCGGSGVLALLSIFALFPLKLEVQKKILNERRPDDVPYNEDKREQ